MADEQRRCEECGAQFESEEELRRHREEAHPSKASEVASLAEQKMQEVVPDPSPEAHGPSTQADRLVGKGEVTEPVADEESTDRNEREVHRPPVPGRDRLG